MVERWSYAWPTKLIAFLIFVQAILCTSYQSSANEAEHDLIRENGRNSFRPGYSRHYIHAGHDLNKRFHHKRTTGRSTLGRFHPRSQHAALVPREPRKHKQSKGPQPSTTPQASKPAQAPSQPAKPAQAQPKAAQPAKSAQAQPKAAKPAKAPAQPAKPAKPAQAQPKTAKPGRAPSQPAKPAQAPSKPAKAPKPTKAEKAAQNASRKQQQAERKAAAKQRKADEKTEKQKQKDLRLVKDNLGRERKEQDKSAVRSQRENAKIKSNYNKAIDGESRKAAAEKKRADGDFTKATRKLAKEKGRKGEKKALNDLNRAKNWQSNLENNHKGRLKQIAGKTQGHLSKNQMSLVKGITKAYTSNFDANGKAKEHLSAWQKFKKIGMQILIEGGIALGSALVSMIPGGAIAGAGLQMARAAIQTGVRVSTTVAKIVSTVGRAAVQAGKIAGKVVQTASNIGSKVGSKVASTVGDKAAKVAAKAGKWAAKKGVDQAKSKVKGEIKGQIKKAVVGKEKEVITTAGMAAAGGAVAGQAINGKQQEVQAQAEAPAAAPAPPVDHRVSTAEQKAESQRHKDELLKKQQTDADAIMAKIQSDPGGKFRRRGDLDLNSGPNG